MAGQKNQCIRESGPGELPHLSIMETFSARCSSSSIDNNKKKNQRELKEKREKKKKHMIFSLYHSSLRLYFFSLSLLFFLPNHLHFLRVWTSRHATTACVPFDRRRFVRVPSYFHLLTKSRKRIRKWGGGEIDVWYIHSASLYSYRYGAMCTEKIRKEKRLHHLPQPLDPPRLLCWFLETTFRLYSTFLSMAGLYRTNAHVTGRGEKNKDLDDKEEKTHLVLHTWTWWAASAAAVSARYWCSYFLFLA